MQQRYVLTGDYEDIQYKLLVHGAQILLVCHKVASELNPRGNGVICSYETMKVDYKSSLRSKKLTQWLDAIWILRQDC